jgi:hypothetical protein
MEEEIGMEGGEVPGQGRRGLGRSVAVVDPGGILYPQDLA